MKGYTDERFRLIFHIGAGKTGTSSIQRSLRESRAMIQAHGCDYWGLMLEHAPFVQYEWQNASIRKEFLSLAPEVAADQVLDVLSRSITESLSKNIKAAVWSHEWFFNKGSYVIPALKALQERGTKIEIVAYVRRHDLWARSAYIQWGIKHKTYKGPIKPFSTYIKERPIRFAGALHNWKREFPATFTLRNFDATEDVVEDFLTATGLPPNVDSKRVNETPTDEELLLRAIFNNSIKGEALPVEFDRFFDSARLDMTANPIKWMSSLYPHDEDLARVWEEATGDRETLNKWLTDSGQLPISDHPIHAKQPAIDVETLLGVLFQVVIRQNVRMRQLQRRVRDMESVEIDRSKRT